MAAVVRQARRRWVPLAAGIVLLAAGIALAVYANVDEIAYRVGLIRQGNPYAAPGEGGSARATYLGIPKGHRLVVPRLGIDVPISDDEARGLATGVWRQTGSARPRESGNMVLAGHRRRDVFSLLHHVRKGDSAIVYWNGAEFVYRVDHKTVMLPEDGRPLVRSGPDRLTMYTCLPRFLGNKRTVVVAYPVARGAQARPADGATSAGRP